MKAHPKKLLLTLALSLLSQGATAGALKEIYLKALTNDPQLRAAQASFRADSEATPQSRAGLLPTLNLGGSLGYSDSHPGTNGVNNSLSLTLSQPVFRAQNWFSFQRSQQLTEQAASVFAKAQQDLIQRTLQAYMTVLEAKTNLTSAQAEEKAIQRRLDQVKAQFEVGLIAITDVQEAQATFDNSQVQRILAEGALDNSYEALERLNADPIQETPALNADYPITALVPDQRDPWVEKALTENIELAIFQHGVGAAQTQTKIAKAGHYPTLDLNASLSDSNSNSNSNSNSSATFDGSNGTLALTLNVPLYLGGSVRSQQREAFQRLDASREQHEDLRRKVTQDTRSLFRNLQTDRATIKARQQAISSSQSALHATSAGFEVGTRNVVDVLQAERQLFAAQRDFANARYTYVRNLFQFKQAIGSLNPEDLYELDRWMTTP
ncbi:MAG: TolC family outer membrane protein [Motiliproteus sp.]